MQARARMIDVANRTGVARSTVFNALRSPQVLAPDTLQRVLAAADELGYSHPDTGRWHSANPRTAGEGAPRIRVKERRRRIEDREPKGPAAGPGRDPSPEFEAERKIWCKLQVGDRVRVERGHYPVTFASIDALMPDGSFVWLLQDGLGRAMAFPGEGIRLRKVEKDQQPQMLH
jgi:hypothetical protein